jgi:glycosyltransferase involved in cell wall biosynthesis
MMRILLSAYQAGPGMGSVSQIGWEWYSRLARRARVTLFTHSRNRRALEKAGAPLPGTDVQYIDTEWFAGPLFKLASRLFPRSEHSVFLVSSLDFFPFDLAVLRRARALRTAGAHWDVVHAVTPVSPSAVTRLFHLGTHTVLGPWNGGLKSPEAFPELMSQDSGWIYRVRDLSRVLDRWVGCTQHAARILVANSTTRETVPVQFRRKCLTVLENGVDLDLFQATPWPAPPSPEQPLKILFVGRLIPVKGINFLLAAARRLQGEVPLDIRIVGDGPMRAEWQSMASSLGVAGSVTFTGALPLAEIAAMHRDSHLFCLPCVRESGGAVLLEAMASARPIVAVGYGGPAVVLDDQVGRALPPDGPEAVTNALCECFRDVARNPDAWRERGLAGRRRAESEFSWDAKIEAALRLYRSLDGVPA